MKFFSERNPIVIGGVGLAVIAGVVVASVQYDKLPFINSDEEYSAYFTEAGGLGLGAPVQVSGFKVGRVSGMNIDGPRVLVKFKVDKDIRLGDRTEAAIKAKTILGAKLLAITPRGTGQLSGPIPVERTTPPYNLPDALGDLTQTISGLDTRQLSDSLATLSETFSHTPANLKPAVAAVGRLADTLDKRDNELRTLLADANKATAVLANRTDQVVGLIADTNQLMAQLLTQRAALDSIAGNLSALSQQLSGFIADNRDQLHGALDHINGVIDIVQKNKEQVQKSIKLLNPYLLSFGESSSGGPFFKIYVANLLPGQFIQPFIDAAFSDLGLDPATLLPSQRSDTPTGQPGTPPLPVPFPRTGQDGPPRMNLPDAITGNPDDHQCGLPGVPLPGPGCYPYREPLPAPPPGGPPPGPPAAPPPGQAVTPEPTPAPIYVIAPNEVPPPGGHTPPAFGGGGGN